MAGPDEALDALMARLARGDRLAFTPVFELLWDPIYHLCLSLLKHEADASDGAQEAMKKILQRASQYDSSRPAMPWAMAIAGWECRTLQRKQQRRREVPEAALNEPVGSHAELELVERDLTSAALSALGELSEVDRETLVATFWDEAPAGSGAKFRKRRERAMTRLKETFRRLYGLS